MVRRFQGPIRPGTSEEEFRRTGKEVRLFQGPVPEGADEETFRRTGRTTGGGRGRDSTPTPPPVAPTSSSPPQDNAEQEAQRIENLRQQFVSQGAQERTQTFTNVETGKPIEHTTIKGRGNERIFIRKDVETGEQTIKTFDVQGRRTGGVVITPSQQVETPQQEASVTDLSLSSLDSSDRSQGFSSILDLVPFRTGIEQSAKASRFTEGLGVGATIKESLFGRAGEELVGVRVGLPLGRKRFVTAREFSQGLRQQGLGGKVVAELLPTTPGQIGLIAGGVKLFPLLPKIAQIGGGGTITALETKRALNPSLPTEKRIASGIIGGLVGAGTISQTLPFIKGQTAKLSPKFKPVKTQPEGFKAVGTGKERIGIIPPKSPAKTGVTAGVKLPKTSPLKRGGFGVRPGEKKLFLGKPQDVATSQIGFFKQGKSVKLQREFFVTPQEPTLKIPVARESRLGLSELFKFQKSEIGFGLPKSAQIGVERATGVTRTGRGGTFAIGKGTELEAIKGAGTIISNVKRVGVTTLKGQRVDIFTFKSSPGGSIGKIPSISSIPTSRTSGELVLGTILSLPPSRTTPPRTTTTTPRTTPSRPPTISLLPPSRPTRRTTRTSTIISPPTRTPTITSPPRSPPLTPPRVPTTITTITRTPPLPPISPPRIPPILRLPRTPRRRTRRFGVQVRRGGVFRNIATAPTFAEAFEIGRGRVARTLGASFRVTGAPQQLRLPKGFRLSTREPGVIIERRGFRLSRTGEIEEIQRAKKRKKKS